MKSLAWKKILPHAIAVAVFLLVTVIFCKPALESGVMLKQGDIQSWEAMSHQSFEYKERTGHFPLWVTTMFSGMPAYQIAIEGAWSPLSIVDKACQLWLPKPMNFFFLACICFYFLCMCLRIRPYAAIAGALAFAYCTYMPIFVTAGHDTEVLTLAYSPALLGGAILLFDRKYLAGFAITTLFTAQEVGSGHQQVSYYVLLVMGIMTLFFIGRAFRQNQLPGIAKSIGLLALAGIIGVSAAAITLLPTFDYAKYSKRGGQLVMSNTGKDEKLVNGKTGGLSKEYAFQWSYGRAETMTLMFPGVMGYGSYYAQRDGDNYLFPQLKPDANVVTYLADQFPQAPADEIAQQMSQSLYWGDQPFTNGPVYLGAVMCFLFFIGMFYLDNKHKWWILTCIVLGILLSWGSHFMAFNGFMFDHLPLYNKFRVPTIALIIPQMLLPIIGALTLNKFAEEQNREFAFAAFKKGAIATAAVFVLALGFYATSSFSNENQQRTGAFNNLLTAKDADPAQAYAALNIAYPAQADNRVYEGWIQNLQRSPDAQKTARGVLTALRKDRASLFLKDILRSFLFILVAAVFLLLFLKRKINALWMLAGVTLFAAVDLLMMDSNYLNEKSFDYKENYETAEFPMTPADKRILTDTDPNFRVFNASVNSPFEDAKTSYYHKSIGGYHPAKLGIYDDLSTYQLSGQPNQAVLNMLNTKYIITGEGDKVQALLNPGALGNVWFVKAAQFVDGPVAEMKALTGLNTRDSAVIDQSFKSVVGNFSAPDSSDQIRQTAFDNDDIVYTSNTTHNCLAVFSEIYYKDWKAFIDGKEVPYAKANYVLRAMVVPAGTHRIEFKFLPQLFFIGKTISAVAGWLIALILVVAAFVGFRNRDRNVAEAESHE